MFVYIKFDDLLAMISTHGHFSIYDTAGHWLYQGPISDLGMTYWDEIDDISEEPCQSPEWTDRLSKWWNSEGKAKAAAWQKPPDGSGDIDPAKVAQLGEGSHADLVLRFNPKQTDTAE